MDYKDKSGKKEMFACMEYLDCYIYSEDLMPDFFAVWIGSSHPRNCFFGKISTIVQEHLYFHETKKEVKYLFDKMNTMSHGSLADKKYHHKLEEKQHQITALTTKSWIHK